MKQFVSFTKKECYHVLRDKKTLFILFGMPIMQILIFGFALTSEIRNSPILILDQAQDAASRRITGKIAASRYFDLEQSAMNTQQMEAAFRSGKIKMAVVFPAGFGDDLLSPGGAQIQLIADASDPNGATTLVSYISSVIGDYQQELQAGTSVPFRIIPETRMLYNPQLKGAPNFVPGVMALVLMLICVMMTAITIVREKETGTMEVLLVSPFKPAWVILAKAVPYFLLSLINVVSILLLSVFVLDLPVKGSLLLLFAESALFIVTCLSLGIFISIRTATIQVAMLVSLMGMLLPTMIFSGFMFPVENMPLPLQVISNIVPAKWYYRIVKAIMIKGLGFSAIWKETLVLAGMAAVLLVVSIRSFKIRLA